MAKELPDLHEGGATAQQVRGERMAQQVCAFELRGQTGALERTPDDTANRRQADESSLGRADPDEDPTAWANWSILTQIIDQRRSNIGRQRLLPAV